VSNRRAWAEPGRLTPEVVALYSAPLRVRGWDAALLEARARPPLMHAPPCCRNLLQGEHESLMRTHVALSTKVRCAPGSCACMCGHVLRRFSHIETDEACTTSSVLLVLLEGAFACAPSAAGARAAACAA